IDAPVEPIPVKGDDGKWYLIYHLFITNWSFSDLTLASVEIRAGRGGAVLAEYGATDLEQLHRFRAVLPMSTALPIPTRADLGRLANGRSAVLFAGMPVDNPEALPANLTHRLAFEANPAIKLLRDRPRDQEGELPLEDFPITVSDQKPLVI